MRICNGLPVSCEGPRELGLARGSRPRPCSVVRVPARVDSGLDLRFLAVGRSQSYEAECGHQTDNHAYPGQRWIQAKQTGSPRIHVELL